MELDYGNGWENIYNKAVELVTETNKASVSWVQYHLGIGYNRAYDIIERMEVDGIISPPNHVGRRDIIKTKATTNEPHR